jgi:hypothetical protein
MAGVVDVFTGARKVHKLLGRHQFRARLKLAFEPVFNRLDIVVGGFLDFLDGQAIGFGEVFDQTQQVSAGTWRQWLEFLKPQSLRAINQATSTCTRRCI